MVWMILLTLLAGCGAKNDNMRVWGDVSYDGKPIDDGQIFLMPIEATKGPSTGGPIVAGKYDLAQQIGPRAGGVYRVEITAYSAKERSYSPNASGEGPLVSVRDQILPDKYNRNSEVKLKVSSVAEENQHDFALAK